MNLKRGIRSHVYDTRKHNTAVRMQSTVIVCFSCKWLLLFARQNSWFNPLTAGAVHIRFLHYILAHYISAFKHVKDKK